MFLAKILLKPSIVTRGQWGAEKPQEEGEPIKEAVETLVLRFTQTGTCDTKQTCTLRVKEVQRQHMDRGEPDITHNFIIGGDGNVYEGRGFKTYPPYPREEKFQPLQNNAVEIAFVGSAAEKPTIKMLKAMAGLVMKGMEENKIVKDVKKLKPCIVHANDVILLKDDSGEKKSTKQLLMEYNALMKSNS